jgi:uncharacterized RDD family membrane protein YckC
MSSGMPSWTANLTARGTMAGPAGMALADIPDRVIAFIIDAIILGIVGFIIGTITTSILGDNLLGGIFIGTTIKVPSLLSTIVAVALLAAVSAAYFIFMWTRMGATLGMRVMKLRVVDAMTGGPISQGQAINRWLTLGLPLALYQFYAWSIIGWLIWLASLGFLIYLLITTAQSANRQGFHDKYSKTSVVKVAA